LHPYLDGELDAVHALELESHLADCPHCADQHRALLALRETIVPALAYHTAPPGLRERVRTSPVTPRRHLQILAMAAAAALLVLLGVWFWPTGVSEHRAADQILASHIRSLQVEHLTDIASGEGHLVKPWFRDKIDFSPPVPDLKDEGFPLTGGRLDYIEERAVAALIYHRRKHAINVFLWPARDATDRPVRTVEKNGFSLISWDRAGMTFWVVSDLNTQELDEFVRGFQARVSRR
jgi:anti-sigma factor RsiW